MSYWKETFKNHRLHGELQKAITLLQTESDNQSNDLQTIKKYLLEVMLALKAALEKVDPELAARNGMLRDIFNPMIHRNMDYLQAYASGHDPKDLIAANENIRKDLNSFLKLQKTKTNNEEILKVLKKLFKLANVIEPPQIKAEPKNIDFPEKIQEQEKKLTELSGNFSKEIEKSRQDLNSLSHSIEQKGNNIDSVLEKKSNDIENKFSKLIKEEQNKHEKIKKLHGIIAGESFTGSYEKMAKLEEDNANTWRGISVVCISFTVITALYTTSVPIAENGNLLIGQIVRAFSIGGAFFYGSFYAAKQSTQHRKNANRARWLAIGINAVGAFTKLLGVEDEKIAKFKIIDAILRQQENEDHAQSNTSNIDEIKKQLTSITGMLPLK